jgi:uncharacterized protein with PIN domain
LKEQLTIKLYLDEMVPTDLARVLRQYGYDVVTAQEAGMLGKTDVEWNMPVTRKGHPHF